MKRSGFTLIELLAVISILALLLLIAIPQVLKVINSSKKKTSSQSVELYGQAIENAMSNYFMTNEDEDVVSIEQLEALDLIEYKGAKVECNEKRIINRKVYLADCKVDNKETEAKYGRIEPICKVVEGEVSTERGTKYSCEVAEDTFYNFYVLGEEDNKVNLIMDRNICEDGTVEYTESNNYCRYAWYDGEDSTKGPITAMQELYYGTKDWGNVPTMNFSYEDEGNNYDKIEITNGKGTIVPKNMNLTTNPSKTIELTDNKVIKSRLPKYSEIYGVDDDHCTTEDGTCPVWLVENLAYIENKIKDGNDYIKMGDVNLDGNITDNDANLVMQYFNKFVSLSQLQLKVANVRNSSDSDELDILDVFYIQRYVYGYFVDSISNLDSLNKYSINNNSNINKTIKGYWLMSSSDFDYYASYLINLYGSVRAYDVYSSDTIGVRPVITVSKSDLN